MWRAFDRHLYRTVAVKLLKVDGATPEQVERFRREARITARLEHPHLVRLLDHGLESIPWLVYELLPGGSLRATLTRASSWSRRHADGQVPPEVARDLKVNVAGLRDALVRILARSPGSCF